MKCIAIGCLVTTLSASMGHAYCSPPSAPYCASRYGQFDSQYDFERCKREMESYKSDVETYIDCQNMAISRLRSENERAISDFNDAVQSFNRRARS